MKPRSLYISYNAITEPITQSQVIPYLKGLSQKGIEFYLLTFEKRRMGKSEERELLRKLGMDEANGPRIKWFHLNYHKRPTVPATAFDIACGFIYSLYIIIRYRINVVHARAIIAALAGRPAAKLLCRKFIFDTRGIDSEEYVDAGTWKRGGFIYRTVNSLEKIIIRSSDHVVVLTEKFLNIFKGRFSEKEIKFSVIPCAVDTHKFTLKKEKNYRLASELGIRDKFVIIYTGSLGTWYMLQEMIDLVKAAAEFIDNVHFLILTQTDKEYALDAVRRSGLASERVMVSVADYGSMPEYLSVASAGLFFIKPVFSKLSSSPVKFGEYLASGLPVIINPGIGDTEEMVKDYKVGAVVTGFDRDNYKKSILYILELLKDADLSARCRMVAEKYLSLDSAVEKYYEIYKNL